MNRRQFLSGLLATSAMTALPPPVAEAVTNAFDPAAVATELLDSCWSDTSMVMVNVPHRVYWINNGGVFQMGLESIDDWASAPDQVVFPVNKTDEPFKWRA